MQSFRAKHKKGYKIDTRLDSRTVRTLFVQTPHKRRNWASQHTKSCAKLQVPSYNTSMHHEDTSGYLLGTFAYGRPSALTGHGFSTGVKKCTARQQHWDVTDTCPLKKTRYDTGNCHSRNSWILFPANFVVPPVYLQTVSRPIELSLQSSLQLSLTVLVCYRSRCNI